MLQLLTWEKNLSFFLVKVGLNSVVTWILGIFSDFVQLDVTLLKMGKAVTVNLIVPKSPEYLIYLEISSILLII